MSFIRGEFPSSAKSRAARWLQEKETIETSFQGRILGEHLDDITEADDKTYECAHDPGTGKYLGTLVAEGMSKPQMVAYRLLAGESVDMTEEEEEVKIYKVREELPEDFEYKSIPRYGPLGGYEHYWLRPEPVEEPEETAEAEEDLPF